MGFLRNMLNPLTRGNPLDNPNVDLNDPATWDIFGGGESESGVRVTVNSTLSLSTMWHGVCLVANSVAKIPLQVIDRETREVDDTHPAFNLVRHRFSDELHTSAYTGWQTLMGHALLQGGGFAYINRVIDRPVELILLEPEKVCPVIANGVLRYVVSMGGQFDDPAATQVKVPPDDILHIRGLTHNGRDGYSLIEKGANAIGGDIAAQSYGNKFFSNANTPQLILEHPGKLSPEAYKRLRNDWQNLNSGVSEAHKARIVEDGIKAKPFSFKPADAQLIESRRFSIIDAANWLQIPPHKLGAEGGRSFASLAEENQSFLDDSLDPWLTNIEAECWLKLLSTTEQRTHSHAFEFNRKAAVRSNMQQRASFYRSAVGRPFMTPNESRRLENMPPVEGGDELYVPLNMAPQSAEQDALRSLLRDTVARMGRRLLTTYNRCDSDADFPLVADDHLPTIREALEPFAFTTDEDIAEWVYREFLKNPPTDDTPDSIADQAVELFLPRNTDTES